MTPLRPLAENGEMSARGLGLEASRVLPHGNWRVVGAPHIGKGYLRLSALQARQFCEEYGQSTLNSLFVLYPEKHGEIQC